MFPEKLIFDGFEHRTNRVNEAITIMCLIEKEFEGKKNGTSHNILNLSQQVNHWYKTRIIC